MTLLDLSAPIESGMPVYPGDPEVSVGPALTVARDGVNVLGLHLGSHSGTHVDAPFHIDDSLPTLDDLPLERFHGPATVVDARGRGPTIGPEFFEEVRAGVIVLVVTGWPFGRQGHPYLTAEAAALLVERGVRTVGIDAFSVDPTPAAEFPAHEKLLRAHAVIAENLYGLDRLIGAREIEVSMFPLRITGGDGSPVRAVARVG
ncbi:cyclase family protein [Nonomuraea sp. PA05]|uniref:cyclase family protein n=1 Tax=Nonomuraea sp. PA05 TaxID=2604466 RepID=UPI0011D83E72|nr:cyclase family protein [Nonomuraea sp. PA05]TYB67378.1 cyclase family protein [Nonomuraea sp. PA05]